METTIIGYYIETTAAPTQQNEASHGLDLQDWESGGRPSELRFRGFQEYG